MAVISTSPSAAWIDPSELQQATEDFLEHGDFRDGFGREAAIYSCPAGLIAVVMDGSSLLICTPCDLPEGGGL